MKMKPAYNYFFRTLCIYTVVENQEFDDNFSLFGTQNHEQPYCLLYHRRLWYILLFLL